MLAVILAAGKGSRLGEHADGLPKPLVKVGTKALIQRQIENLQAHGVEEFLIVTGHRHIELEQAVLEWAPQAQFVLNADYAQTNTLHSLHLAMEHIGPRDFYYLNADVLSTPALLDFLKGEGNLLAVEPKNCGDEEVKVIVDSHSKIQAISKKLDPQHCLGEFIGIAKFAGEFQGAFAECLAQQVSLGHGNDYFEGALNLLCAQHFLKSVDIRGNPVIEIDFPEDLAKARLMASQENLL